MAAIAEATVSLRRAHPGDDALTGGISVLSPALSDSRQRGQRPVGPSAESGALQWGHVARFALAKGSNSDAGVHRGRNVLEMLMHTILRQDTESKLTSQDLGCAAVAANPGSLLGTDIIVR
jgi:hypothetical protein